MKYYGITDKGSRKNNQDSYIIATNKSGDVFALVCDGIGGNRGGDVASQLAVSSFSLAFAETSDFADVQTLKAWLRQRVAEINRLIFERGNQNEKLHGMGTTVAGVLVTSVGIVILNIGDSRTYGYTRSGLFKQLTVDDTLVNDMLMHGELTPQEAANYPQKNVLTNALGVWENVRMDIREVDVRWDGFLICSDGLHGYVDEKIIRTVVLDTRIDPARRSRLLIEASLRVGGYDNVTAILMDLEGEGMHD